MQGNNLDNLGDIVDQIKNDLEQYNYDDVMLSRDFKDVFQNSMSSSGYTVMKYKKYTTIIVNSQKQMLYVPNQWFVLGKFAVDLVKEIISYRTITEATLDQYQDEFVDDKGEILEKKQIYKNLKTTDDDNLKYKFKECIEKYLQDQRQSMEEIEHNVAFIMKFVTDDKWWYGGKGIERTNDFYVSPILGSLNLVNASSSFVATITYAYAKDDKLYSVLNNITTNVEELKDTDDEYQRAAQTVKEYVSETGFVVPSNRFDVEEALKEFREKFAPKVLLEVPDGELLQKMFYTMGDNTETLCCWLEHNSACREYFGSIAGGSAYKFGLFQKKDTGEWLTGSPQKPRILTEDEALDIAKSIRDALVKGTEIIKKATLNNLDDFEKMDNELKNAIGEQFYNLAWFHKYFFMMCPDKLSGFHSNDWQNHVLRCLRVKPSGRYYARSAQIAKVENYAELFYSEFIAIIKEEFGGVRHFVRIGTKDSEKSYIAEWKQRSVVGIGWRSVGSLEEYVAGDGISKDALTDKMVTEYYPDDKKTASRKAGELARFFKTSEDTVFVAMDGERLIAFIDDIGTYFYDASSAMAHMKQGRWHSRFLEDDVLPEKSEGKLTSCYQLTNDENLMFLYEKYYYGEEQENIELKTDISETEDIEYRNKIRFKAWLFEQVKPEGDSDAGNPYTKGVIKSYVGHILKTPMPDMPDKSLFYTLNSEVVEGTLDSLKDSVESNGPQRSAVKKYLEFIKVTGGEYMSLIFNTELETKFDERNRIVFGAPGTGKSFGLKKDCKKLMEGTTGYYERVTFHPDYSYSQFVGTYKPVMGTDEKIRYDFVPGPFMRVYVEALKNGRTDNPQPYLLLIEEINRAKVAAVFGDVFQLLDRDDDGVSEYEIQASEDIRKYLAKELNDKPENFKKIRIPNNMFIWATMNSADQGVFPMDTAFKRRWNFEYLGINKNEEEIAGIGKIKLEGREEPIEWNKLRKAINDKMSSDQFRVNEDKLMGPFFLSKKIIASDENGMIIDTDKFIKAFKSKVIMYLYEDAVKQGKHKFFAGCDSSKYSSVCNAFDEKGIGIFGENFEEQYYEK